MSRNAFASVLPLTTTLIWPVCWTTNRRFVPSSAPVTKIGWLNPVSAELSLIAVTGRGVGSGRPGGGRRRPGLLGRDQRGAGRGLAVGRYGTVRTRGTAGAWGKAGLPDPGAGCGR